MRKALCLPGEVDKVNYTRKTGLFWLSILPSMKAFGSTTQTYFGIRWKYLREWFLSSEKQQRQFCRKRWIWNWRTYWTWHTWKSTSRGVETMHMPFTEQMSYSDEQIDLLKKWWILGPILVPIASCIAARLTLRYGPKKNVVLCLGSQKSERLKLLYFGNIFSNKNRCRRRKTMMAIIQMAERVLNIGI